jgi:hypothetical protein
MNVQRLRGEKDGEWVAFRAVAAPAVRQMQTKLQAAGFLPNAPSAGVFDYRTLSAVRLFQEYVRSVEGIAEIGAPDGAVGPLTLRHLDRWAQSGKRAEWAERSPDNATPGFRYWIRALALYQAFNAQKPVTRMVQVADAFTKPSDTLKIARWNLDRRAIHLIGIRREEWRKAPVRRNDDVFVLLVNGVAFGFSGSTDPNPKEAKRADEPYLVRGQHQYRFGWHKLSSPDRVYRAFRPVGPGVLACRDTSNDDALTDDDLVKGLSVVPDINIHWSGAGTGNWSAGCQVIEGRHYLNHRGVVVDCSAFASPGYAGLGPKTRGAYNVLVDLITVFAPSNAIAGTRVSYSLLHERDLDLAVSANQKLSEAARIDLPAPDLEPWMVPRLVGVLVG